LEALLWDACRKQARPRLNDLAQRIDSLVGWSDLVLPDAQLAILHEIATHVRRRAKVYESWGFSSRCARGLGISALFGGPSGTGKTMAAEVLARELQLDLYRIDLSQVVSKYIGETEKNLSRVFDAAEEGGAVLLFDEPTRCSASVPRSRTAMIATRTSKSAICSSAWRRTAASPF
jgi:SpoVK/Ycf46/Vps4 family AAA+-type ATPase